MGYRLGAAHVVLSFPVAILKQNEMDRINVLSSVDSEYYFNM